MTKKITLDKILSLIPEHDLRVWYSDGDWISFKSFNDIRKEIISLFNKNA